MTTLAKRLGSLESMRPTKPWAVRFLDTVPPERPSHTEDGRPILYVTWLKEGQATA